jgi:hypothetical protein
MSELEELIGRVKSYECTKHLWRTKHDSIEFIEASKLNRLLTGIPLNKALKCECVEDLFFMLKLDNTKQKAMEKANKQFHLQKGKVIQSYGNDIISEHSSDEQLIEALRINPALIKFFDKVPDNWEQIIKKGVKVVRKAKEIISEVKEIVSEIKDAVEDVKESTTLVKKRKPTAKKS